MKETKNPFLEDQNSLIQNNFTATSNALNSTEEDINNLEKQEVPLMIFGSKQSRIAIAKVFFLLKIIL